MRQKVVDTLISIDHEDMYFLTADVGYNILEPLKLKMQGRFINVGLAEQSMIGIASGLALSGKQVFTYTMCAFYLRAFEQIKLDLCYQNALVTMIGVGTQFDYNYAGTTHFAFDDDKAIGQLLNIDVHTPKSQVELESLLIKKIEKPQYIRVGGYEQNEDFDIDWQLLLEYPKCGGSKDYFRSKFGKK